MYSFFFGFLMRRVMGVGGESVVMIVKQKTGVWE